jgi:hypothetical protein
MEKLGLPAPNPGLDPRFGDRTALDGTKFLSEAVPKLQFLEQLP